MFHRDWDAQVYSSTGLLLVFHFQDITKRRQLWALDRIGRYNQLS